ncbi:MAG: DUF2169 domain-containing protein [Minicystis sp.]
MQLVALSPVHVAKLRWRRDARAFVLTVVVKASFDLVPGEMRLSAQQDVINEQDQRWEDDPGRSVHAPGDLMPLKPRADVTLVGTAFAPQGKPVRSLLARLVCGTIDKAIAVYGDRPRINHPEPAAFTRMPLRYERAAGGPGTANPVGTPERPPNLEPARRVDGPVPPIGFGPIASDWPERRAHLPQHTAWSPEEPFPEDLDPGYFNVAPADQQLGALRHDQALHLENLHPEHARLSTRLPGLRPQAFVDRPGAAAQEIEMRPDGMWIDTDRARCTVTWRTQIPLAQADEAGRVLVAMVGARQQLSWDDMLRLDEALRGGQQQPSQRPPPRPAPEPAPRAHAGIPSVAHDDEEDDVVETSVTLTTVKPADLARAGAPPVATPPPAPPPAPPAIPAMPPVPKRTTTLQGQAPARRPTIQPVEPPPPPPPRPQIDSEPTATDLFVIGEHTPIFDNAPAWLAQSPISQRPGDTSATPFQPPPTQPLVVQPPAPPAAQPPVQSLVVQPSPPPAVQPPAQSLVVQPSPPPPAPVTPPPALAEPAPAASEPRSPWAVGGPATAAATAAPVAAATTAAAQPAAAPVRAPAVEEIIDLLWFDPEAVPRIRARWPQIVEDLDFEPLDPRHDLPVDDPGRSRDRHHVFGVLTRAEATDARGVAREMMEAIGDHGRFTAPIVIIGGELRFPFDEIETLKTAAAAARPLAKDDKKLTDLLEMLGELLDTPLLQGSPGAVESLLRDLTSAIRETRRALPVKYLDAHIERVLLEKRRYQRRTVFGGTCIRALLGRDAGAVPAYLPDALAEKLPLMTQMKARLVAEVCPSQDQYESHPQALRVLALGRVMSLESPRR